MPVVLIELIVGNLQLFGSQTKGSERELDNVKRSPTSRDSRAYMLHEKLQNVNRSKVE